MQWHMWVVLIAGSTGSALRAVRPPNLHITPNVGAISVTPPSSVSDEGLGFGIMKSCAVN